MPENVEFCPKKLSNFELGGGALAPPCPPAPAPMDKRAKKDTLCLI